MVLLLRLWGKAVNFSLMMKEKLHIKVSPPFEGGVVGMIDYHVFRELIPDRGG
jgi:hypothetical protein